jgi:AcrR family transcriptional regulator
VINSTIKSQVEDVELINHRRAQFVTTAINLFRHKGYHTTTVKEIAKAAGVSPGLIYQYVTDKEDILFLALQHIVHVYRRVLPQVMDGIEDPLERFIVAFEEYCRVIDANRDASMLTYIETRTLSSERREALKQLELDVNALMERPLRECVNEGLVRADAKSDVLVTIGAALVHTWALKHWRLKSISDLDNYVDTALDMILMSVLTETGLARYRVLRPAAAGSTRKASSKRK